MVTKLVSLETTLVEAMLFKGLPAIRLDLPSRSFFYANGLNSFLKPSCRQCRYKTV